MTDQNADIWQPLEERRRQARESFAVEDADALELTGLLLLELQGGLDRVSDAHLDDSDSIAGAALSAGVEAFTAAVCAIRDGFPFQAYPCMRFALECALIVTGLAHVSTDDRAKQLVKLRAGLNAAVNASPAAGQINSDDFRTLLENGGEQAQAEGQYRWIQHLHLYAHPSPYALAPYYLEGNLADPSEAARLGRRPAIHTLFGVGQILGHALGSILGQMVPDLGTLLMRVENHLVEWSDHAMPEGGVVTLEDLLSIRSTRLAQRADIRTLKKRDVESTITILGKLAEDWTTMDPAQVDPAQAELVQDLQRAVNAIALREC